MIARTNGRPGRCTDAPAAIPRTAPGKGHAAPRPWRLAAMLDLDRHFARPGRPQYVIENDLTTLSTVADTAVVPPHEELRFDRLKCTGRTAASSRFFTCVRLRLSSMGGGGGEGFGLAGFLVRQSINPVTGRPPRLIAGRGLT